MEPEMQNRRRAAILCAAFWRRGRESNPSRRLCRPLHNRFATSPECMVKLPSWTVMFQLNMRSNVFSEFWSGRRVSNSRPQPWQGCALPTELLPHTGDALSQKLFQLPRQAAATDFTANWSGRRVSNSRPQPWQGCALPTELLPLCVLLCPSFAAMSSQQASIIDDLIRTSRMTKN